MFGKSSKLQKYAILECLPKGIDPDGAKEEVLKPFWFAIKVMD